MAGWRGLLKILTPRLAYVAAAGVALSAAGAFAAGIFVLDQGTLQALELAKTDAPPRLDGKADDEAWRVPTAATVAPPNATNLPPGGTPEQIGRATGRGSVGPYV